MIFVVVELLMRAEVRLAMKKVEIFGGNASDFPIALVGPVVAHSPVPTVGNVHSCCTVAIDYESIARLAQYLRQFNTNWQLTMERIR